MVVVAPTITTCDHFIQRRKGAREKNLSQKFFREFLPSSLLVKLWLCLNAKEAENIPWGPCLWEGKSWSCALEREGIAARAQGRQGLQDQEERRNFPEGGTEVGLGGQGGGPVLLVLSTQARVGPRVC